ncbi:hypothetical protein [Natronosalvus vescus]|uniref:hypothetical protein n=1 Tax=Natronosalvus vescus TaxID=2953881 RepID=UPI002090ECA5|nr:hypothetical protein [Natronosalvus vescus]
MSDRWRHTEDDGDEIEIEIDSERDTGRGWASDDHAAATANDRSSNYDGDDAQDDRTTATPDDLADELGRIDLMTTPDGYVEGRVTGLTPIDETTVELEVTLPHDVTTTFRLEKPIPWSRTYLLARIVEDVGYDAASIDHLVGEPIYVARVDPEDEPASGWAWGWDEWRDGFVRTTGNALLDTLGGQFRLEEDHSPEWRLVDPLERVEEGDATRVWRIPVGAGLALLGVLVAAVGTMYGTAGAIVVSGVALAAIILGLSLVVIGLAISTHVDTE